MESGSYGIILSWVYSSLNVLSVIIRHFILALAHCHTEARERIGSTPIKRTVQIIVFWSYFFIIDNNNSF